MNEYEKQAEDFAKKYGVTMTAEYKGHYPRLGEYAVAQFQITLRRDDKSYQFDYSASLHSSWSHKYPWGRVMLGLPSKIRESDWPRTKKSFSIGVCDIKPRHAAPTVYDILSCLQKCDPGTHEEFCADFGYDPDSRKGLEIYLAVQNEWRNVEAMFRDCLDELAEIN